MSNLIDRTGERAIMNNGLCAVIISYKKSSNIDVQFENGGIAYHKQYSEFAVGGIDCPMIIKHDGDICTATNYNLNPPVTFTFDREDLRIVSGLLWHFSGRGYIHSSAGFLHRLIMSAPKGVQVDHINGDKTDNRKCNLRLCNNAENNRNRPLQSNNTSGYKGVRYENNRGKWLSRIKVNGKTKNLGRYDSAESAAIAYNEAAKVHFGEFAKLNRIEQPL